MLFILLFVGLVSAAVASPSAEPLQTSARISLPQTIQDSLPWFAVFELQNENTPFTRNHLNELAKKSERVALVYFATWCIPCREGLKQISENADKIAKSKTGIILVNVGEREKDKIEDFLKQFSLDTIKTVVDPYGRLTEGLGLIKGGESIDLPRTIILDNTSKPQLMIGAEGMDYIEILIGEIKK